MKKILLIEDEKDMAAMTKKILVKHGYEVESAYNGEDGLAKARTIKPDLIVLDVKMPKLDGYKVCENLKEDPEFKNIPVIMLTARDSNIERTIGLAMGAEVYLSKPYDPAVLLTKISQLLKDTE